MKLNIQNETSRLRVVILGIANSLGGVPEIEQAYDPKSIEYILIIFMMLHQKVFLLKEEMS